MSDSSDSSQSGGNRHQGLKHLTRSGKWKRLRRQSDQQDSSLNMTAESTKSDFSTTTSDATSHNFSGIRQQSSDSPEPAPESPSEHSFFASSPVGDVPMPPMPNLPPSPPILIPGDINPPHPFGNDDESGADDDNNVDDDINFDDDNNVDDDLVNDDDSNVSDDSFGEIVDDVIFDSDQDNEVDDDVEEVEFDAVKMLEERLRVWALEQNVTHKALSKLCKLLRKCPS